MNVPQMIMENARRVQAKSIKDLYDSLPDTIYDQDVSRYDVIVSAAKLVRQGKVCDLIKPDAGKEYKKEFRRSGR